MRVGTISVREALGDDVPGITDKDIQEALWHYFYDVEKSVNYLLQSRTAKKETTKKKAKGGSLLSHLELGDMAWRRSELEGAGAGMGNSYGSGGASPLSYYEMSGGIPADINSLQNIWLRLLRRARIRLYQPTFGRIWAGSMYPRTDGRLLSSLYILEVV
jgi:hypothetical protein